MTPPNCEIKDDNGRFKCYDRFEVTEIGYNEYREINRLVIINSKTHNVAFEYGTSSDGQKGPSRRADSTDKESVEESTETATKGNSRRLGMSYPDVVICERCGKAITGVVLPDGTTMTGAELVGKSKLTYNGVYCFACMQALNKAKKKGA